MMINIYNEDMFHPTELKIENESLSKELTFRDALDPESNSDLLSNIQRNGGRALIVVHPFDAYTYNEWDDLENQFNRDFYMHADENHLQYLERLVLLLKNAVENNLPIIFMQGIDGLSDSLTDREIIERYKKLGLNENINVIYTGVGNIEIQYNSPDPIEEPFELLGLKSVIIAGVNLWGSSYNFAQFEAKTENEESNTSVRGKLKLSGCVGGVANQLELLGVKVGISIATFPQQMPRQDELTYRAPIKVSDTTTISGRYIANKM